MTMEAIVSTPMEIDHIVPESLGALTEEDNLWLASALCNQHKGNSIAEPDPLTGGMYRFSTRVARIGTNILPGATNRATSSLARQSDGQHWLHWTSIAPSS